MSAHDHAQDAEHEVIRLATDVQILVDAANAGVTATMEDLEHLRATVESLRYLVRCTVRAVAHEPREEERRHVTVDA